MKLNFCESKEICRKPDFPRLFFSRLRSLDAESEIARLGNNFDETLNSRAVKETQKK